MEISELKLHQYRSYERLLLHPAPGVNVITGENAQGKTNALEALFLCALGRSHRTSRDAELIKSGCAGAYVGLQLKNTYGSHSIEMKLRSGERKQIFIDANLAAKSAELMGQLNVVLFSPEDLSLVKGGPAERRRFADMELSQLFPAYYVNLQQYNIALKQRNALLKSDTAGFSTLSVWDEQLAFYGAKLMEKRAAFIQMLQKQAEDFHLAVTNGKEKLSVRYAPNVPMQEDEAARVGRMLEALENAANEDMRRGFTSVGPHRDDIQLLLCGEDARVYASQGQQRTAALSLKLSMIGILKEARGETPVLLLDDVLSELDDTRARLLVQNFSDAQAFITCTGVDALKRAGLSSCKLWKCKNGDIQSE